MNDEWGGIIPEASGQMHLREPGFNFAPSSLRGMVPRWWNRLLTLFLLAAVAVTAGASVYFAREITLGEHTTDFYMLNREGKAQNYPQKLTPGQKGQIMLVVANNERETVDYVVEVAVGGTVLERIAPIRLDGGGRWVQEIDFAFATAGRRQKVEFLLYKEASAAPYRSLYLWVDVADVSELTGQGST